MRRYLLLLACLTTALSARARDFDWVQVDPIVGQANPSLARSGLAIGPAGLPVRARLLSLDSIYGSQFFGDCRVEQFSPAGALLWSATLAGNVQVRGLAVDSADAIVVFGSFRDTLRVDPAHQLIAAGDTREFLLRFDPARGVQWLIDVATLAPDLISLETMTIDPQDRVWIGSIENTVGGISSAIRRLDGNGAVALTLIQDDVRSVAGLAVDTDGTLWATGAAQNGPQSFNGYVASPPFFYNTYLVKYAPNGQAAWVRFVEDITFQFPQVICDGAGGVYFAGDLYGDFAFGDLLADGPDWVFDFFITRVDADGDFLWLREVPSDAFTGDAGHGASAWLSRGPDGGLLFAGFSRFSVDWLGEGTPPPSYGSYDLLLLEYAANGDCISAKTAGSTGFDTADAAVIDAAGTAYLCGQVGANSHFDDFQFGGEFLNSFIAALPDPDATAVDGAPAAPLALANHPNPFNPSTRIRFHLPAPGPAELAIYDLRGARLTTLAAGTRAAGEQSLQWDGRDAQGRALPSGVYLARLETAAGSAQRRLVLIR